MKEVNIKPWDWKIQNLITDIECPYCGVVRTYSGSKFNFDSFTFYCKSCDEPFIVHSLDNGMPRSITVNEKNEVNHQSSKVNEILDEATYNNPNYVNVLHPRTLNLNKEKVEDLQKEKNSLIKIFKSTMYSNANK